MGYGDIKESWRANLGAGLTEIKECVCVVNNMTCFPFFLFGISYFFFASLLDKMGLLFSNFNDIQRQGHKVLDNCFKKGCFCVS